MILNKKDGVALAIVLIITAALSVLGVGILSLSLAETKQVAYQNKKMQAYYLAKSGADIVSGYIIENPSQSSVTALVGSGKSSQNNQLGNGSFDVQVTSAGGYGQVIVEAKGYVGDIDNTVKVYMSRLKMSEIVDKAIYSNKALDIKNMIVTNGDIQSGENITFTPPGSHNEFTGKDFPYSPRIMEIDWGASTAGLPVLASLPADRIINNSCELPGTISLGNGQSLTFNTSNVDMVVLAHNLSIKESLIINGTGRVFLYVDGTMTVKTNGDINTAPSSQLFIYLNTGSTLDLQAGKILNGYIFGPEATVIVQSDHTLVNGAIFSDILLKNSNNGANGRVNYVPLTNDTGIGGDIHEYRIVGWQ